MDFFSFAADNARQEFRPAYQPTPVQLAGTPLARSLKMNDEQCASGQITKDVWLETDKALWAYADKHGVAQDVRAMANRGTR